MRASKTMVVLALTCAGGCGGHAPAPVDDGGSGNDADGSIVGGADAGVADPEHLLSGSWACLEGAHADGDAVVIDPIDRWIVGYEPAPRTANPPIMLVGPHLEISGGFRLSMRLSAAAATPALLTLNGRLPIIYDEWRQEGTAVAIGLEAQRVVVQVWDGQQARPTTTRFATGLTGAVDLVASYDGSELAVEVAGTEVGRVPAAHLFADGHVYFGAIVAPDNRLTVHALAAAPIGGATLAVVTPGAFLAEPASTTSLRALARPRGVAIGTAVASFPLLGEPAYATTLGREFAMVTPENMMKFQFIHPRRDVYAFCDGDALVAFAEANGMSVHGHALVWGEAIPEWVSKGVFSNAEITEILHEHISTVVGHYRGRIAEWDVLNEPLDDDTGALRDTIWRRALGDAYVATIFQWAHEADPDARLFINEYGIESTGSKANQLFALVKQLKQAGVPIAGVGFQGHEDVGSEADPAQLRANMARYADIGVDVRISELDDNPGDSPSGAQLAAQAAFFGKELDVCLSLPHCKGFSMWGFTDKYSSLAPDGAYDLIGHGLVFDEVYAAKAAYQALTARLMAP